MRRSGNSVGFTPTSASPTPHAIDLCSSRGGVVTMEMVDYASYVVTCGSGAKCFSGSEVDEQCSDACPSDYSWSDATNSCSVNTALLDVLVKTCTAKGGTWNAATHACDGLHDCPAGQIWNDDAGACYPGQPATQKALDDLKKACLAANGVWSHATESCAPLPKSKDSGAGAQDAGGSGGVIAALVLAALAGLYLAKK